MNKRIFSLVVPFLTFALVGCQNTTNSEKSEHTNVASVNQNETATIKWDWDNGDKVVSKTCEVGQVPSYDYATDGVPRKDYPDEESCYVFSGWSPEVKIARKAITYTYTALYVVRPAGVKHTIYFDCAECMVNGRRQSQETHTAGDLPLTYRFTLPSDNFVRALPASHCVQIIDDNKQVVADGYTYDENTGKLTITKLESNIVVQAVADYACASLIYQYNETFGGNRPITIKPGAEAQITYVDWGDGSFLDKGDGGTFTHTYSKPGPDFNGSYTIRIYQDRRLTSFILSDATTDALDSPLSEGNRAISTIDYYYAEGVPIKIDDYAFAWVELLATMNLARIPHVVKLGAYSIRSTGLDAVNWSGAKDPVGVFTYGDLYNSYANDSTWIAESYWAALCPPPEMFYKQTGADLELSIHPSSMFDVYFSYEMYGGKSAIFRVFIKPEYSSFYRWPSANFTASFLQLKGGYKNIELRPLAFTAKSILFNTFYDDITEYYDDSSNTIKLDVTIETAKINYLANGGKINGQDNYTKFASIGSTPIHPTESDVTLTRAPDEQNMYIFAGWDNEPEKVSGDQTYRAIWDAKPKSNFNISWYDNDKTTRLGKVEVPEGALPSGNEYKDITYKMHDNTNHYSFDSWKEIGTDNPLSVASKDTSYYASFKVSNTLSIKFNGTNVVESESREPSFLDSCTYRAGSKVIYKFSAINGATLPEQILVKYAHANEGAPSYIWNSVKGTLEIDESLLNDDISILINA